MPRNSPCAAARAVTQLLREQGSLSPRELWEALGVSKQGVVDLLRPLMAVGLVKHEGTLKSGRYVLA